MITKHEAAQRFAEIMLNKLENPLLVQTNERMAIISENAFKLAGAMQAEADKREDKTRPEVLEEWQPDWSQAPSGYDWFCVGSNGGYGFFSNQAPELFKDYYFVGADGFVVNNHGYQGAWRDSLRKRPQ